MPKHSISEPPGTWERWVTGAIRESAALGRAVSVSEYIRRAEEAYRGQASGGQPATAGTPLAQESGIQFGGGVRGECDAEVARREWSINKLAREAGIAAKTIRDMRALNYTPTLSVVQKLSAALHMDPCDLLRNQSAVR